MNELNKKPYEVIASKTWKLNWSRYGQLPPINPTITVSFKGQQPDEIVLEGKDSEGNDICKKLKLGAEGSHCIVRYHADERWAVYIEYPYTIKDAKASGHLSLLFDNYAKQNLYVTYKEIDDGPAMHEHGRAGGTCAF